ncbi:MAG: malonyl-ACP O-methyltransferase BioC [Gammaproteobacteria bacterium]
MLDKNKVAKSFSRASSSYEDVAVVQQAVLAEHLERLSVTNLDPDRIIDLGSGTGTGSVKLEKLYKKSRVYAFDLAQGMLKEHQNKLSSFRNRTTLICADIDHLPIQSDSADLIFSNLALQWSNNIDHAIGEFRRILRTGGLLSFTTVGPDTLKELRAAWQEVEADVHIHDFLDMHIIGDALIKNGFGAPVLDVDRYTLTYPDTKSLLLDLKNLGATNASSERTKGLSGRKAILELDKAYEKQRVEGKLPLTYEIVYAHAWVPPESMRPQDGSTVAHFPVSEITRRS